MSTKLHDALSMVVNVHLEISLLAVVQSQVEMKPTRPTLLATAALMEARVHMERTNRLIELLSGLDLRTETVQVPSWHQVNVQLLQLRCTLGELEEAIELTFIMPRMIIRHGHSLPLKRQQLEGSVIFQSVTIYLKPRFIESESISVMLEAQVLAHLDRGMITMIWYLLWPTVAHLPQLVHLHPKIQHLVQHHPPRCHPVLHQVSRLLPRNHQTAPQRSQHYLPRPHPVLHQVCRPRPWNQPVTLHQPPL